MLVDLCLCMTLHDERGGGGVLIKWCKPFASVCCNMHCLMRGGVSQMLLEPCFCITLQDGKGGVNPMFLQLCFCVLHYHTAW